MMMGDPLDIPEVHALQAELARLREERDALQHRIDCADTPLMRDVLADKLAAEARCARLQQALTKIRKRTVNSESFRQLDGQEVQTFAAGMAEAYDDCRAIAREALAGPDTPADSPEDGWFIPEGDRRCGVVHMDARATCMKRRGHGGSHGTAQGTWIDGPWCEYPADSPEEA